MSCYRSLLHDSSYMITIIHDASYLIAVPTWTERFHFLGDSQLQDQWKFAYRHHLHEHTLSIDVNVKGGSLVVKMHEFHRRRVRRRLGIVKLEGLWSDANSGETVQDMRQFN